LAADAAWPRRKGVERDVTRPAVGIIGGGILGMTTALRLLEAGVDVALFERSNDLGGLVGSFDFDGYPVDRFYHVVLPTDHRVRGLAGELGLGERFQFRPTAAGFYDDGRLFSMSSPRELLTLPLLRLHDRIRLGAFVARCGLIKTHEKLDDTPLLEWLERLCGTAIVERLWKPLLDSKFDGRFHDLPATYIWARTRRMASTRDKAGREIMGWLEGGYTTLIDALENRILALGGVIKRGAEVERVIHDAGGVSGLVVDGSVRTFDHVVCTLSPPLARRVLPSEIAHVTADENFRYLGVICVLLRTSRSVSPYYTLNITDRRIPLTTVIETTHVVDPEHTGGHLVYAAKYVDSSSTELSRPPDALDAEYRGHLRTIFPDLRDDEILGSVVQSARVVEPVHLLGGEKRVPAMFPVPGLALASTANVYPDIVNGQSVIGVADRLLEGLVERLPAARWEAA
jgi:protoporphyrinogen oxidase